jgi:hypothetical protein
MDELKQELEGSIIEDVNAIRARVVEMQGWREKGATAYKLMELCRSIEVKTLSQQPHSEGKAVDTVLGEPELSDAVDKYVDSDQRYEDAKDPFPEIAGFESGLNAALQHRPDSGDES